MIVDTVGRALDHMAVVLLATDAKNGNRAGGLSLQGYGALKTAFVGWMNKLRSYGLDVLLLAHMDEQKSGDETKERLDIQGGSKNEVYKVSDAMGRIYMENRKRVLNFSPSDVAFGKNPAQLEPMDVPHFDKAQGFLAGIIATTKAAINKQSAEQAEVNGLLVEWQAKADKGATADDFNALIPLAKAVDPRILENAKRVLIKAARDHEFVFDVKAGAFVGKAPANGTAAPAAQPAANGNGAVPLDASPPAPSAVSPDAGGSAQTPTATNAEAKPAAEPAPAKKAKAKKEAEQPAPLPPVDASEAGSNG